MKKIEDFLNDRLPHAGLLPHSLMHSVAPLVLGLFVACLVTLSCNTSDVLIESFELLLLFDLLFMILSRYSFQYRLYMRFSRYILLTDLFHQSLELKRSF